MDYKPLTENQKRVLEAILGNMGSNKTPPSIRQIMKITGIGSLRGVTLQLDTLEKLGFISRNPKTRKISINNALIQPSEKILIPLMTSTIPAGYTSPTDDHSDQEMEVSISETKGLRNVFAVKVRGDSMVDADIEDGDTAIISPQPVANDREIVAAQHKGGVTLKRYRVVDGIPMLLPANPKYKPITNKFEIQGRLINVIKGK